jgi:hypothetical protein
MIILDDHADCDDRSGCVSARGTTVGAECSAGGVINDVR